MGARSKERGRAISCDGCQAPRWLLPVAFEIHGLQREAQPLEGWQRRCRRRGRAGGEGHVYDFDSYVKELRTYQSNTLLFADVGFLPYADIRWVGNESGFAPEDNWNVVDRLGYLRWRPIEADTPLRKLHWFWHPNDEKSLNSLDELLEIYHKTVGRGAQLVLGLAPDNRGLLPDSDGARLREFGEALRVMYGRNLVHGDNPALDGDPDTVWTATP